MKILITDDHALFREGLRYVLMRLQPDVMVFEAGSFDEAVHVVSENPDLNLLLLDMAMPAPNGIDAIKLLRDRIPHIPIVIVSALEDNDLIQQALDCGVHGYIPKSSTGHEMLAALKQIFEGNIYIPPKLTTDNHAAAKTESACKQSVGSYQGLTLRQIDVLVLLCKGLPNKSICSELGISEGTVKRHITEIFRKLKVANRTQAVVAAQALGMAAGREQRGQN